MHRKYIFPIHRPFAPWHGVQGFSLVEVVIAIGLVSFALLAIVGSLSVGLCTMNAAASQQFEAMIAGRLRSDLQQLSFPAIQNLDAKIRYYSHDGREVSLPEDARFAVTLKVVDPVVVGTAVGFETRAREVKATLEFPLSAPPANRQKQVFSILVAAQGGV